MKIGDKLTYLRKSNDLSQSELAKKLNISRSSIGMFESYARVPTIDTLIRYAKFFEVSLDYLLETQFPLKDQGYITINVYSSIPADIPIEDIEDISNTEDLSLKEYDRNKEYLGLVVEGDSMYPKYLDGDTVIIEKTPDCKSGKDAAVYVNGYEATLKTLIKNENGTITLKPINPNYSPMTYGPDDDSVNMLGIVKEMRRKVWI